MSSVISKLVEFINKDWECFLITSEESRLYVSGFQSSDGYIVLGRNGCAVFADSRYFEACCNEITDMEVILLKSFDDVTEYIDKKGYEKIFSEDEKITVSEYHNFQKKFKNKKFIADSTLNNHLWQLRKEKSENEVKKIIKAQRIAETALDEVLSFIEIGKTEREIAAFLEYSMRQNGADGFSFDTIAITGENTSKPHGVPGDVKVKKGDFITMDFGAIYKGYHSDMTRTVAVGEVTDKQIKVYNTVLNAGNECIKAISPGEKCSNCDKIARDIIKSAGYGEFFGHATGHGVGIEIHEKPNLSPKCGELLKPGNVVTVEPGIYLPGEFGVRIEDMILVTDSGNINLTKAKKDLIVL